MSFDGDDPERWSAALSEAVRAIRQSRGLSKQEVADRMGLPLRTYEHFEGGGGKVNVEKIYAFAVATQSDPFAIVAAILVQSPLLAARSSQNKLILSLAIALHDFDEDAGDDIALLEAGPLLAAFSEMFATLADEARDKRRAIEELERRTRDWRRPGEPSPQAGGDAAEEDPSPDDRPDPDPDSDHDLESE